MDAICIGIDVGGTFTDCVLTEGCPLLTERRWDGDGPDVVYNSWLDPVSGRVLHVEVALEGEERGFEVKPRRWTQASSSGKLPDER